VPVTKGRINGHRWCCVTDATHRARHYCFYGSHRALLDAMEQVLTPDEFDQIETAFDEQSFGRTVLRQVKPVRYSEACFTVIWLAKRTDLDPLEVLVHEIVHASGMVLSYTGVEPSFSNDEQMAHMVSWLFGQMRRGLGL
jgi:hypothetical protein